MKPFRLAGACLAAVVAGWSMLAAGIVAGPGAAGSPTRASEPGVSVVLTAMQVPQARVLDPGPPTGLTATAGNGRVTLFVDRARLRWGRRHQRLPDLPGNQPGRRVRRAGQWRAGPGHQLHADRADQRHRLLLQSGRGRRRRTPRPGFSRGVGHSGVGQRVDVPGVWNGSARSTDRPDRDRGQCRGQPVLDRTRLGRRFAARPLQRLRGHRLRLLRRYYGHGHERHGDRADQRHRLPLRGDRGRRQRQDERRFRRSLSRADRECGPDFEEGSDAGHRLAGGRSGRGHRRSHGPDRPSAAPAPVEIASALAPVEIASAPALVGSHPRQRPPRSHPPLAPPSDGPGPTRARPARSRASSS